ncbi:hypothetical protein ACOALZ_01590 [Nocardiopsis algeriensis]|uniref:hypothetical protein n=1 Tax=Nocardiopsis algeriensis TaxID=1478215 RepID=UPI003B428059
MTDEAAHELPESLFQVAGVDLEVAIDFLGDVRVEPLNAARRTGLAGVGGRAKAFCRRGVTATQVYLCAVRPGASPY